MEAAKLFAFLSAGFSYTFLWAFLTLGHPPVCLAVPTLCLLPARAAGGLQLPELTLARGEWHTATSSSRRHTHPQPLLPQGHHCPVNPSLPPPGVLGSQGNSPPSQLELLGSAPWMTLGDTQYVRPAGAVSPIHPPSSEREGSS